MMFEHILNCRKCELYKNQRPLLDKKRECKVIWVGLSAKKTKSPEELPLSPDTHSGMLIKKIEEECDEISTYKTNLVKCLPLNQDQKLRYPTKHEIDCCIGHLISEIELLSPKIVFLLGEKVYTSVGKHLNISFEKWDGFDYKYKEYNHVYFIPVQHPSHIYTYKRKYIEEYVQGIKKTISELLNSNEIQK